MLGSARGGESFEKVEEMGPWENGETGKTGRWDDGTMGYGKSIRLVAAFPISLPRRRCLRPAKIRGALRMVGLIDMAQLFRPQPG